MAKIPVFHAAVLQSDGLFGLPACSIINHIPKICASGSDIKTGTDSYKACFVRRVKEIKINTIRFRILKYPVDNIPNSQDKCFSHCIESSGAAYSFLVKVHSTALSKFQNLQNVSVCFDEISVSSQYGFATQILAVVSLVEFMYPVFMHAMFWSYRRRLGSMFVVCLFNV